MVLTATARNNPITEKPNTMMKTPRNEQRGETPKPARELKSMVCLKMQPSLKAAVQQHAQAHGMTFAELVRYALQHYLDTHTSQH